MYKERRITTTFSLIKPLIVSSPTNLKSSSGKTNNYNIHTSKNSKTIKYKLFKSSLINIQLNGIMILINDDDDEDALTTTMVMMIKQYKLYYLRKPLIHV